MTSYINPERRSRMAPIPNDLVGGDCDAGEHQCVSGAIRLFRSFINGSITPEQDKYKNCTSANTSTVAVLKSFNRQIR